MPIYNKSAYSSNERCQFMFYAIFVFYPLSLLSVSRAVCRLGDVITSSMSTGLQHTYTP